MTTVTLYTKPGCHLCEAVEQVIAQVRRGRPFDLMLRNILDDPHDLELYQHAIPVVLLNGVEIARYRLTVSDLDRALRSSPEGAAGNSQGPLEGMNNAQDNSPNGAVGNSQGREPLERMNNARNNEP